ncbi:MAG: bifunctional DNA-formamidopyrimidine glycosylase/DNA-(apurinic or apyrimidinic site) lyase [Erysipelotrichaceae bacterium]|nr:bifunctional DNA-formamidopyrimidine glycosylase/DNA-(apurinic or apyrimidinic site) lyase [Erysipelotrichaceae bacterium]
MPELPEVQTVLDTLAVQIKDAGIKDIRIIFPKIIEGDAEEFRRRLIGQHFRLFRRRGKYLLFEMDDLTMVSHLRMEGKYYIYDKKVAPGKHDHVVFELDDGRYLHYNDVRKFGRMGLMDKKRTYIRFHGLGPEPFWDSFNADYCRKYLKERKAEIKPTLLDQSFVAGIGNIYADEILFESKIHPKRSCDSISDEEIKAIIRNTRKILRKAIRAGGTTIRSYTSSLGVTGLFQMSLRAHDQKKCPVCKGEIRKIKVGGRGTYYCPNCQKESK